MLQRVDDLVCVFRSEGGASFQGPGWVNKIDRESARVSELSSE